MARFYAPSTIFIDELDSIFSSRSEEGQHEASRRMKSELLVQMDGVGSVVVGEEHKMVIVLGATNFPWVIDEAARRRLEKRIYIPLPDHESRIQLFEINLRGVKLDESINIEQLAKMSEGYSGSDITNVCRDASFMAMRQKIKGLTPDEIKNLTKDLKDLPVTMKDFEISLSKVSRTVSNEDLIKHQQWDKEFGST